MNKSQQKRIIFFIGSLRSGGKERRLIELLTYLKNNTKFELLVVLRQNQIDYPVFYNLDIPFKLLTENYKRRDIRLPYRFFKICTGFKPYIIHTWGAMPATVALPTIIIKNISHLNSQITSAPPHQKMGMLGKLQNKINFMFSDLILSNSLAGINSYQPSKYKSLVIYNGVDLERFKCLPAKEEIKNKYNIKTPYAAVMVASFSDNKDFDLFVSIAIMISRIRQDISFICVGDGMHHKRIKKRAIENQNIIFTGRINDVEALVNVCDVGVLFSNRKVHGEGISNTIIEYMSLSKPVIANDAGGTVEIVKHEENGYLITDESTVEIGNRIIELIDNLDKRIDMGVNARKTIEEKFSIDKMGNAFIDVYDKILGAKT